MDGSLPWADWGETDNSTPPPSHGNPYRPILTLRNLLRHKANKTYPSRTGFESRIYSTYDLNAVIRNQLGVIKARNLALVTDSEAMTEVLDQLWGLANKWGYFGGKSVGDREIVRMELEKLGEAIEALGLPGSGGYED